MRSSTPSTASPTPCRPGETLAILGESGSGKSVSAQAVMGILDSPPAFITQGDIRFRGEDMLAMPEDQRRKIRGAASR